MTTLELSSEQDYEGYGAAPGFSMNQDGRHRREAANKRSPKDADFENPPLSSGRGERQYLLRQSGPIVVLTPPEGEESAPSPVEIIKRTFTA